MHLSKEQIQYIARDLRDKLGSIGSDQRAARKEAARTAFFKTPSGKKLAALRILLNDPRLGESHVSKLEENAVKNFHKPFDYISQEDIARRVAVISVDAETYDHIRESILKEWYRKLKPAVRRAFNLNIK
jgi:hypothetical protein